MITKSDINKNCMGKKKITIEKITKERLR